MFLLGTVLLTGCDTPPQTTDGAAVKPVAKAASADRYIATGSRIAQRADQPQQAQPDMLQIGGDGYADSVRGQSGTMGQNFKDAQGSMH
jgi:hypothetical protein